MIEHLETLITLSRTGTMVAASTELKISQSAVSKRIAALERHYRRPLIERHGRRVVLTHHGTRLVERVSPLIGELRSVFLEDHASPGGRLILGVSEAILASWGPQLFADALTELPELDLTFHAQRSPVVLDRIRAGEYMVGVCTGSSDADTDLQSELLALEPMVLIPARCEPLRYTPGDPLEVLTIESRSGAWASIDVAMRHLNIHRSASLESFFSVAQMAIAGFGHGLVPVGVARTLGVPDEVRVDLGGSGLNRPVRFVARKSMFSRPLIQRFYAAILARARAL